MPTHFPHNADRGECASISRRHRRIQAAAAGFGAVFMLMGIVAALRSGILYGGYYLSMTNTVVHVIVGACGFVLAGSVAGARGFLVVGGLAYLVLCLSGITATHVTIQAILAAVMLGIGMWPADGRGSITTDKG